MVLTKIRHFFSLANQNTNEQKYVSKQKDKILASTQKNNALTSAFSNIANRKKFLVYDKEEKLENNKE